MPLTKSTPLIDDLRRFLDHPPNGHVVIDGQSFIKKPVGPRGESMPFHTGALNRLAQAYKVLRNKALAVQFAEDRVGEHADGPAPK